MLLSCVGSLSYLWVGKSSTVPFFKRSNYEMVPMTAANLTDEELLKWVKYQVKKIRSVDAASVTASGDSVVTPYLCERSFTHENLCIVR